MQFKLSNLNMTRQPMELACNPQCDVELDTGWPVDKGHNRRRMEARSFTRFHTEAASSKACLGGKWTSSKIPAALSVWCKPNFCHCTVCLFPLVRNIWLEFVPPAQSSLPSSLYWRPYHFISQIFFSQKFYWNTVALKACIALFNSRNLIHSSIVLFTQSLLPSYIQQIPQILAFVGIKICQSILGAIHPHTNKCRVLYSIPNSQDTIPPVPSPQ